MGKRLVLILAIFLVGFGTSFLIKNEKKPSSVKPVEVTKEATSTASILVAKDELFRVTRVIDGDTIELENGTRVRYIGIDTPELYDPRKPVECFGEEAKAENTKLVEGRDVLLVADVSQADKYNRFLRYVYAGDVFVNDYLVRQGFAHASTFPPDIRFADQFISAENEARENNRGLWGGCPTVANTSASPSLPVGSSGCIIKGNISSTGEKIYHVQGCGSYAKTVIDEGAGERWFCSEDEAVAAGWRKAKNCP